MPSKHRLYCLEHVPDIERPSTSVIVPSLEQLARQYGVTNVHAVCDSIEGFESSLSTLLYEDRNFKDYTMIYLVFEGKDNAIKIDNFYYSLEEIAEFFEGKLRGKIVHFANSLCLDLEDESFQYFLDVTGATALSGYVNPVPLVSTVLDNVYFALREEHDCVVDLVEALHHKAYTLCMALGFRLYY